jgi:hypothetical protein
MLLTPACSHAQTSPESERFPEARTGAQDRCFIPLADNWKLPLVRSRHASGTAWILFAKIRPEQPVVRFTPANERIEMGRGR